jgi:hypothetical protein
MYNVVLNCSSEMLSMLLLKLAKGRQTDTSKRLLWVRGAGVCRSYQFTEVPSFNVINGGSHAGNRALADSLEPLHKLPSLETWKLQTFADICRQCWMCLDIFGFWGLACQEFMILPTGTADHKVCWLRTQNCNVGCHQSEAASLWMRTIIWWFTV